MVMTLHSTLQRLRHAPGLRSMDVVWNVMRRPYQRLLDPFQRGVKVLVGGECVVRLPAQYTNQDWGAFEPVTVRRFAEWMHSHPASVFLDIGSAQGIYGALALTVAPATEVISCESSIPSLKVCSVVCGLAGGARQSRYVHGFISDRHESGIGLVEAERRTVKELDLLRDLPDPASQVFACLGDDGFSDVPIHSLDGLLSGVTDFDSRDVLIKCDIEGAELLALRGGVESLRRLKPEICLSVHALSPGNYGDHPASVLKFLESLDYHVDEFDVDHERHWWCTPRQ